MKRLFPGCVLLVSFATSAGTASAEMTHPATVFTLRADSEGASATELYPYFNGVGYSGLVTHTSDQIDRTYFEFRMSSIKQAITSASLQFYLSSPYDATINVGAYTGTGQPNLAVWNAPLLPITTFHAIDPPFPPRGPGGPPGRGGSGRGPGGRLGSGLVPDFSKPNYSLDITESLRSFATNKVAFVGLAFSIPNNSIGKQVLIQSVFTPDISFQTAADATPEPSTIFLAITGAIGVIGLRLRRK